MTPVNWEQLADAVLASLQEGLSDLQGNLRDNWDTYGKVIAQDVVMCATEAIKGDEEYQANLAHLKAQAITLGAMIAMDAEDQVVTTIQKTIQIVLAVLVPALKQLVLPG